MVDNEEETILPKTGSEKVGQESAVITPEKIESYLDYVRGRGCTNGTVMNYRRSLTKLYHWLPETKEIKKEQFWHISRPLRSSSCRGLSTC